MSALRRGFTLIEMMVGVLIGSLIVLAAVAFAGHEVRTLAISNQVLEVNQSGRAVLDMIADDVTNAGSGVGYNVDGRFEGIRVPAPNSGAFPGDNRAINVSGGGATVTDDLVLAVADGATASIVEARPDGFTLCGPGPNEVGFLADGERVVLRDAFGLAARSAILDVDMEATPCPATADCQGGQRARPGNGCTRVTITEDPNVWATDPAAASALVTPLGTFANGQIIGNFRQVIWYVEGNGDNGRLRRHVGNAADCVLGGDSPTCGDVAADGVEALHYAVFAQDPTGAWNRLTADVTDNRPLRVDVEIVVRARSNDINNQPHDPATLRLEGGRCIPAACATRTMLRREVFRTSVEIKNSGYMRLSGGSRT